MGKKFPYQYDVEKYIEKALEKMLFTHPWAKRELFDKRYFYAIEKENNRYQYIEYYENNRKVLDCNGEEFINHIIYDNEYFIEKENPVIEEYNVNYESPVIITGWYLEQYRFRKHQLGTYSAYVQAGDRVAGGSRTFYIPPSYFKKTYEEFLDNYCKLVPGYFGLSKEDLIKNEGLKEFLGY